MSLLLTIIYIAALGILAHYIGEALPRSLFDIRSFPYKQFKFEKSGKFYHAIHIHKWKDKVPDMSRIMKDMIPKKISFTASCDELYRLARETCVAEAVHNILGILFLGIYFFWKSSAGIVVTAITLLINFPFILIQRYNRPKIIALADRLYKREARRIENPDSVM